MGERSFELRVKITAKELFAFMMKHTYSSASGIFGILLSVGCLVLFFAGFAGNDDTKKVILLIIGLLFTVVNPVMLYTKAKQQALKNPLYKEILVYTLDEEGISLTADGKTEAIRWESIVDYKKGFGVCLLYTSKIHSILLPFSSMGEKKDEIVTFIQAKVRG